MYDEIHFQEGVGPAKQLQLLHGVAPADFAAIIAAAIPDPIEQEKAGESLQTPDMVVWPWTEATWFARLAEAYSLLGVGAMPAASRK